MDAITRLLKPRSVAVIGASADITKTAGRPVAYLLKHGFSGKIFPVNPKASEICVSGQCRFRHRFSSIEA